MTVSRTISAAVLAGAAVLLQPAAAGAKDASAGQVLTGAAAFDDWKSDAPGVWRRVTVASLPKPFATPSAGNPPSIALRPAGAALKTLPGFTVQPFATGLTGPRLIRTAPNGDVFVVESGAGRVRVLRMADGAARPAAVSTFTEGLREPFGVAFYPAGPNPQWVYVANTNSVVRFPYRDGDLKARGAAETVVAQIAPHTGGHVTRDIAFSPDGATMFVSVGSGSNDAEHMPKMTLDEAHAFEAAHAVGSAWGSEERRADILAFTPQGGPARIYAAGIRNCVGLTVQPATGTLWCSTNERDGLGDNLVPDYITRVKAGGFYGWPWWYMGGTEDPRHKGERPDLAGEVLSPDVPVQPHSATLEMVFYPKSASGPAAFPVDYRGDAFAAFHGSWNRELRTGYKVVRVKMKDGQPTGAYEDVLTGFVIDDHTVWGRPVGVAVAHDGALLVSDDASGTVWRVAHAGG